MAGLRVSAWAIRNPIPVTALFIGLMIAGIGAFMALPIKLLPDTSVPIISVTVTQYGAAAAEMEKQISRPIESGLSSVAGVKHVTTSITQGVSAKSP
jgi:hydrophobic/amphiphilic exporter-1 (mainly G- bacteria), HAE1 family